MNRVLLILFLSLTCFVSCKKESAPTARLTKTQINRVVDSIVTIRSHEIEQAAANDLRHRLKIEVRVKVDSIKRANLHKADTVSKAQETGGRRPTPKMIPGK